MQPVTRALRSLAARLRRSRGQGTVEYVGIILAVGALLMALVGPLRDERAAIAHKIGQAVSTSITKVIQNDGTGTPSDTTGG